MEAITAKQGLFHFIINATESTERRTKISQSFIQCGITPHFFSAIMGKDLSQAELATCVADKGLLNKGEIGCA